MGWYKVTKHINGHQYDYWQRTERHGKQVKTYNKYIGPSTHGQKAITSAQWNAEQNAWRTAKGDNPHLDCPDCHRERKEYGAWRCSKHYDEAEDNANAIRQTGVGILMTTEPKAHAAPSQHDRTIAEHHNLLQQPKPGYVPPELYKEPPPRREDYTAEEWLEILAERRERKRELAAYIKKRDATIRAVKRKTKGIKSVNPFLAQAIVHLPTCYMCGKQAPSLNSRKLCAECAQ